MNRLSCSMPGKLGEGNLGEGNLAPWNVAKEPSLSSQTKACTNFGPTFAGPLATCEQNGDLASWVKSPKAFFAPLHYEPKYSYPLIVWLHNNGFNENQINQVIPHISLRNYVAVGVRGCRATDASGRRFEWPTSPAAVGNAHDCVISAIDEASERFNINPTRIILAGYRDGGAMALRVALQQPERFAAVVSLGGTMPADGGAIVNLHQLRKRRLPMLWQWAVEGNHFQSEHLKRDICMARMIQATVEVRQYVDDDEMSTFCLTELNQWVMRRIVAGDMSVDEESSFAPVGFSAN